ncbi:lamin tail domain-containing protein [Botrimarina mediterranea]|uniref:LTD domain-containing protein n=1 Tax=Botrimarina mediterranea TaxID=2528022 RepID=A0A518K8X8_9BACT|nr:lamin tail domain-containing protein [Botrimarina mediterranea]QDV74227.1 hypothetical protein Spa11_24270 [Botrimarina mediterranea]
MRFCVVAAAVASLLAPTASQSQLLVTEVMYDPASDESRWEWIEVHNTGAVAIDLDGYVIDRVGDRARTTVTANILSNPLLGSAVVNNPTVLPAGGIAVLYNGPGLSYDRGRFRAAWPQMPAGATLIGVEGWSSNALTNAPKGSDYAPSLPAMTIGLWADVESYRLDAADFGTPSSADRRVFRVANAAAAFGYDDDAPWRDPQGKSAIHYISGPVFSPTSWGRSNAGYGGATASSKTFVPEPINAGDYGSPGMVPSGTPARPGLMITEILYDSASNTGAGNEWEWVEVFNSGPSIDFAATPYWFDDDDQAALTAANLTTGSIASGGVAVLFNASAASIDRIRDAWDQPGEAPINWIAVSEWPALANGGDAVGLWNSGAPYAADKAGEEPTFANAVASIAYDDSSPWPTGVNGDAIRLSNLGSDPADPGAWARARGAYADPQAYRSADVLAPGGVVDNAGGDHGSPGYHWPDIYPPLPGDYNNDGRVDAADYTVWRDNKPLPTETASVGVNDAADYAVWRANYRGAGLGGARAVPEPTAALSVAIGLMAFGRRGRRLGSGPIAATRPPRS